MAFQVVQGKARNAHDFHDSFRSGLCREREREREDAMKWVEKEKSN